jgi:hypothetical protein
MIKLNKYEQYAYLYSSWTALIIPYILTSYIINSLQLDIISSVEKLFRPILIFSTMSIIYGAVGFYIRELFRSTSKIIYQYRIFKEDETKMPTTEYLLWKNHKISKEQNESVRNKIFNKFNYLMLSKQEETEDEQEARLNIVGAVAKMKESTRNSPLVIQSNYRYGFHRNMLGGLIWSLIILILFLIVNYIAMWNYGCITIVAIVLVIIQGLFSFVFTKYAARNYARTLINTFDAYN